MQIKWHGEPEMFPRRDCSHEFNIRKYIYGCPICKGIAAGIYTPVTHPKKGAVTCGKTRLMG